ncbi:phytanoyl-CoA dioxygenase family protein [Methylobacterium sp. J-072]|uniref:phytanoyl-CoA dioxygenase family protein n=1 Tax=Methylobacterium sp. J-072 TaxID=2836651 RepID=UPI001FBBABC1|nr:phytanoyl-CoA dioxygenase family protein [Methylobacterium sp. J-072]MCJ2095633.1 phytanoyl-CoA dioxygenase family protein [Methylobacterium sp. J-072]
MMRLFKRSVLTDEHRRVWARDGFLILRAFFDHQTVDAVNSEVAGLLRNREAYPDVSVDVLSDANVGKRMKIMDVPEELFSGPIKINDLFLNSDIVRACTLDERLSTILGALLDGDPMVCNSLNFIYGSTQGAHYDSWFMAPPVKDKMVAVSICLDENADDNGPIFLYPGSHTIPPYVFPHGKIAKLDADLGPALRYVEETSRAIEPVTFYGQPGDVLIWHGQVLHGGSPIKNPSRTRRSLVTHYWRAKDYTSSLRTKISKNGYVMKRAHQEAAH